MGRNVDDIGGIAQTAVNADPLVNRRNLRFLDGGGITWSVIDDSITNTASVSAVASGAGLPAGALLDFAGVAAPSGWLLCDGAAYGRTAMDPNPQPTLFAAIGTTWGVGDGVTTFNVPDFRRRTTVGSGGTGTGVLGNAVGDVGGAETHTLVTGEMPNHGHGVNDPGHAHSTNGADVAGGSFTQVACGNGVFTRFQLSGSASTGISVNSTGGGGSHNNIQPSAVVLKIIKA